MKQIICNTSENAQQCATMNSEISSGRTIEAASKADVSVSCTEVRCNLGASTVTRDVTSRLRIRFWWWAMRLTRSVAAPLDYAAHFCFEKWETAANTWWIEHPAEYEKLLAEGIELARRSGW